MPGRNVERLKRSLEQIVACNEELRTALDEFDQAIRQGLRLVHTDVRLVDALLETQAGAARARFNKALDELETARRNLRIAMAGQAVEEGASLNELAKAIGVSRQLLSRIASEARSVEPPE